MNPNELQIPPEALSDPGAFEILRLWAAHKELHVVISSRLGGGPEEFGQVIADLFEHASCLYSQRDKRELFDCRDEMLARFLELVRRPESSHEGSLPKGH